MDIFYSAHTRGFYFKNIHGANIPKDALKIDPLLYKALQEGQKDNNVIVPDGSGMPVLSQQQTTKEEDSALEVQWIEEEMIRIRDELEKVQDFDPKAKGSVGDWRNYRKAIRSWSESSDFPNKDKRPAPPDMVKE